MWFQSIFFNLKNKAFSPLKQNSVPLTSKQSPERLYVYQQMTAIEKHML